MLSKWVKTPSGNDCMHVSTEKRGRQRRKVLQHGEWYSVGICGVRRRGRPRLPKPLWRPPPLDRQTVKGAGGGDSYQRQHSRSGGKVQREAVLFCTFRHPVRFSPTIMTANSYHYFCIEDAGFASSALCVLILLDAAFHTAWWVCRRTVIQLRI